MPSPIDLNALSTAICKGVVEGNAPLIASLVARSDKSHELRGVVQQNSDKVWELDGEIKLIKGFIVSLNGTGDGSTGSVPRLERDVRSMGGEIVGLRSEMGQMRSDVSGLRSDIAGLRGDLSTQKSLTDGWTGGAKVAWWLIGTCITLIGLAVTATAWIITHGVKP